MNTNLHYFHGHVVFEALVDGEFTKVKTISKAIHGKVYLMRRVVGETDEDVVVKKMENYKVDQSRTNEPNEMLSFRNGLASFEDALNEIGVLTLLNRANPLCRFILELVGVFRDATHTWLTTENCSGGELFALIANSPMFPERSIVCIMWQLLHAVDFLHHNNIGHRDISLENVLVKSSSSIDDVSVRLMDFGQAVQLRADDAARTPLRYFHPVGKNYYRPPEAYVPRVPALVHSPSPHPLMVRCPPNGAGEVVPFLRGFPGHAVVMLRLPAAAIEDEECMAEVAGYTVEPMDVFALGVCLFIMTTQNPPWQNAVLADQVFRFIQARGIRTLLTAWKKNASDEMTDLLSRLLVVDPTARLTLSAAFEHDVFTTAGLCR